MHDENCLNKQIVTISCLFMTKPHLTHMSSYLLKRLNKGRILSRWVIFYSLFFSLHLQFEIKFHKLLLCYHWVESYWRKIVHDLMYVCLQWNSCLMQHILKYSDCKDNRSAGRNKSEQSDCQMIFCIETCFTSMSLKMNLLLVANPRLPH